METERARAIAERLHATDVDESGAPVLMHLRRVASLTPQATRPIAWLHEALVRAAGRSGELARLMKLADLEDRCRYPRVRPDGWSPPYALGLGLLGADTRRGAVFG